MNARPPPLLHGFPVVGHAVSFFRDPERLVRHGYETLGSPFALRFGGRNVAVLLGPDHQRIFFEATDKLLSLRGAYPFFIPMFDDKTYFLADDAEYKEQRTISLPAFSPQKMEGYVDAMVSEVEAWMDELGDEGEMDLVDSVGPIVMWIAARAFLGDAFRQNLAKEFFRTFRNFSAGLEAVLPLWLPLAKYRRRDLARAQAHAMIDREIGARRAHPEAYDDFLTVLVRAQYSNGDPLPDSVIRNLVMVFVWAGHETTVGHTAWAIIQLLQHPDDYARVLAELAALPAKEPPALHHLKRAKHLEWALKETERMRPVAHVLMRIAKKPLRVGDFEIPEGWFVMSSPAVGHRLGDVFANPERYDPQRFSPERAEDRRPYSLIGFGGSTHRCLGVNFAYLEMKVILALLMRRYSLELVDRDPQPIAGAGTKWPERPCRVRYARRDLAQTSFGATFAAGFETRARESASGCPVHP